MIIIFITTTPMLSTRGMIFMWLITFQVAILSRVHTIVDKADIF